MIARDVLTPLKSPAIDASGLAFAASQAHRLRFITLDLLQGKRLQQPNVWLRIGPTCLALHSAQPVAERTPRRIINTVIHEERQGIQKIMRVSDLCCQQQLALLRGREDDISQFQFTLRKDKDTRVRAISPAVSEAARSVDLTD